MRFCSIFHSFLFIPANLITFSMEYNFQKCIECNWDMQMFEYNTLILYFLNKLRIFHSFFHWFVWGAQFQMNLQRIKYYLSILLEMFVTFSPIHWLDVKKKIPSFYFNLKKKRNSHQIKICVRMWHTSAIIQRCAGVNLSQFLFFSFEQVRH